MLFFYYLFYKNIVYEIGKIFDYKYNGEQKYTMIIGSLIYQKYKVNILYKYYEPSKIKCII